MKLLLENAFIELFILVLLKIFNKISNKVFIIILCFLIFFFRCPKIKENKGIVSPTFGKLMKIEETSDDKTIFHIYLNIFDPHVQYSPSYGKILKQTYFQGNFHPAYLLTKSQYNERLVTLMETQHGDIEITQYGGMVVRRVVSFVKPGDIIKKNQLLGMIKFSSRVDITIPRTMYKRILVNEGQKINAGDSLVI